MSKLDHYISLGMNNRSIHGTILMERLFWSTYFARSSALRLVPHLRQEYVLTLSCVSETITVLGLSSVSQFGHLADTV